MKFIISLIALAGVALAQSADIGLPKENQKVIAGEDVVVQVQRPNTLTGSEEINVSIGFTSCPNGGCPPAEEELGTVVYSGSFTPEYHESPLPPYENFTVKVPSSFAQGKAQVNVAHFALVGASNVPLFEPLNQTIIVA
ncbi:hypothetical protein N7478_007839 [Penicillium angulare]|uniref:uncharacterized protein n=1 Tax=Penicillium angulare TaxID=116970 RepID=UPI00254126C9|nr:uncharacterized protein N7478_007839 [Penicillium angulare]KAJ5272714.1 hypothetical protein N7478_007839 [Penicillium angulare]